MNFERTSFLVFDEADRMFDLGFETQVKSISDHVRSDRQCLMFSATFPPKIEKLTSHALSNPIKVLCGDVTEANADIIQTVHILPDLETKLQWLYSNIVAFCTRKYKSLYFSSNNYVVYRRQSNCFCNQKTGCRDCGG